MIHLILMGKLSWILDIHREPRVSQVCCNCLALAINRHLSRNLLASGALGNGDRALLQTCIVKSELGKPLKTNFERLLQDGRLHTGRKLFLLVFSEDRGTFLSFHEYSIEYLVSEPDDTLQHIVTIYKY